MTQIECKELSLGYEGRVISKDITFSVNKGDYLCIVGENGTGKSTLIKTLLKLKTPLSGTIDYKDGLTRRHIGYLPQQTQIQRDFPASVKEIVRTGCLGMHGVFPFYTREEKKRADSMLAKLGITDLRNQCYRELSGGQQQRVLLARALCATEEMLLLDEPVAGLDPKVTQELYELIADLNKKEGITIIMVSHDMEAAVRYATHVLHLSHTPLFFGSKEQYVEKGFDLWDMTRGMGGNTDD